MGRQAIIEELEQECMKKDIPEFKIGDTLKVQIKIIEGNKERVQAFTGTVIARKGQGLSDTVTLYRVAYGCSMERVVPLHSPRVDNIEVMRHGKVRKSKLYYLRGTQGKAAKVKERIVAKAKAPKKTPEAAPKVEDTPPKEEKPTQSE